MIEKGKHTKIMFQNENRKFQISFPFERGKFLENQFLSNLSKISPSKKNFLAVGEKKLGALRKLWFLHSELLIIVSSGTAK